MTKCYKCGFYDVEIGCCTCPSTDKWYACPIESEDIRNKQALEDYIEWLNKSESEGKECI